MPKCTSDTASMLHTPYSGLMPAQSQGSCTLPSLECKQKCQGLAQLWPIPRDDPMDGSWQRREGGEVPAIPMGRTTLSHGLDEDAQLLQAHVSPSPHANDADAQAFGVWKGKGDTRADGRAFCSSALPVGQTLFQESNPMPKDVLLLGKGHG